MPSFSVHWLYNFKNAKHLKANCCSHMLTLNSGSRIAQCENNWKHQNGVLRTSCKATITSASVPTAPATRRRDLSLWNLCKKEHVRSTLSYRNTPEYWLGAKQVFAWQPQKTMDGRAQIVSTGQRLVLTQVHSRSWFQTLASSEWKQSFQEMGLSENLVYPNMVMPMS